MFGSTKAGDGGHIDVARICTCGNEQIKPIDAADIAVPLIISTDPNNQTANLNLTEFFSIDNQGAGKSSKCGIKTFQLFEDEAGTKPWTNSIANIPTPAGGNRRRLVASQNSNSSLSVSTSQLTTPTLIYVHAQTRGLVKSVARVVISVNKRACGYETITYSAN